MVNRRTLGSARRVIDSPIPLLRQSLFPELLLMRTRLAWNSFGNLLRFLKCFPCMGVLPACMFVPRSCLRRRRGWWSSGNWMELQNVGVSPCLSPAFSFKVKRGTCVVILCWSYLWSFRSCVCKIGIKGYILWEACQNTKVIRIDAALVVQAFDPSTWEADLG